jgi:DNA sulfur modification protein DndC
MFDDILIRMEAAIAAMASLILAGTRFAVPLAAARTRDARRFFCWRRSGVSRMRGGPSLLGHLELMLAEIQDHADTEGLPVTVHVAAPSLAIQFVVSTIGRGTHA